MLAVVGLVIAHAANNLINDYFDMTGGVDTEGYVRALYAPHPVLSGWVTKSTLRNAILLLTVIDGLIMLLLAHWHGPLVIAFALAGLFLSVFYVAPPFSLKRHGLGELDVFLTWGPLMIGGTYLVATGSVPLWVIVFSMPYALLVTISPIRQAHRQDRARHRARHPHRAGHPGRTRARRTNQALMIMFYPLVLLAVLAGWVGPWVLLAALAIPTLIAHAQGLQRAQASRAAAVVPGARLAAVVRWLRLPPRAPGRRAADGRPAAQRARTGEAVAALALGERLGQRSRA